ncbi:MAG TPA: lysozyme [Thermoleophilaceae bacterium]
MKTSPAGIKLIARFEGFRARPYKIGSDPWTIGYGETRGVGPNTPPVTERSARQQLIKRVNRDFAPAVNAAAKRWNLRLNQNQFDALVSFVYNLGTGVLTPGAPTGDSIRKALAGGGKPAAVTAALALYVMPGTQFERGLRTRRAMEARLYTTPVEHPKLAGWRAELAALRARFARDRDETRRAAIRKRIGELKRAIKRKRV